MKIKKRTEQKPMTTNSAVEISGRREVLVSGCTGILSFSDEKIGIRAKNEEIRIIGNALALCWAGEGRLLIKGEIDSIELRGQNENI